MIKKGQLKTPPKYFTGSAKVAHIEFWERRFFRDSAPLLIIFQKPGVLQQNPQITFGYTTLARKASVIRPRPGFRALPCAARATGVDRFLHTNEPPINGSPSRGCSGIFLSHFNSFDGRGQRPESSIQHRHSHARFNDSTIQRSHPTPLSANTARTHPRNPPGNILSTESPIRIVRLWIPNALNCCASHNSLSIKVAG